MSFTQLHIHHSSGSRLDSIASSLEFASRAVEYGHEYLAITDHGSCAGWYELQNACNKYNIKPIFGLEQYVIPDDELITTNDRGKRVRCKNNHLVLLAKNKTGFVNIMRMHYLSMLTENDHFYYNNHSTFSEIFKYSEGVVCGTACMMSPFANALKSGNDKKAEELFVNFLDVFKDDFYVEVQLNELTRTIDNLEYGQKSVNDFMMNLADKYGVPKVITGDVHYLDKEDYKIQDISLAMREKRTMGTEGFTLEARTLYYHDVCDYKEFNQRFGYGYTDNQIEEMCSNTEYIAKKCDYVIPERTKMIYPHVTFDDEFEMERLSNQRLKELFGDNVPQIYIERLNTEIDVLKRKGFGSYVMVLEDLFNHCNKENIPVGFGRGCFLPDNIVTLENCKKKISEVQEGDKIISGFGIKTYVEKKFEYDVDEKITELTVGDKKIKCTQDHKILVVRKGLDLKIENAEFIEASKIQPGDCLVKI